jgi:hypothetical protein
MSEWKPGPIDTAFVFGTGICEGSWEPVRQAIVAVDQTAALALGIATPDAEEVEVKAAYDAANFWFADFVHKRRRIEALAHKPLNFFLEKGSSFFKTKTDAEAYLAKLRKEGCNLADIDRQVKHAIADHLGRATTEEKIRLRPQFLRVMGDNRFRGSAWFATTNWDLVLETWARNNVSDLVDIVHIHGDIRDPTRLKLPTEVVEEPYRSDEERDELLVSVLEYPKLSWAKQVCLYGLGLSISDAELVQTLEMGLTHPKNGPGTVLIYNRRTELPILRRRLQRFCRESDWKIECIAVDEL